MTLTVTAPNHNSRPAGMLIAPASASAMVPDDEIAVTAIDISTMPAAVADPYRYTVLGRSRVGKRCHKTQSSEGGEYNNELAHCSSPSDVALRIATPSYGICSDIGSVVFCINVHEQPC